MKKETEPKKIGRPAEVVPQDKVEEIIEWISDGKPLREYCRLEGKPPFRTVYNWLEKDKEFMARFAQARDVGADIIAEEALAIIDTEPMMTGGDHPKYDSAYVAWLRNRAEYRLKLLAKWNPKKYGDRMINEHTGSDGGPIEISETERAAKVKALIAAANQRKAK